MNIRIEAFSISGTASEGRSAGRRELPGGLGEVGSEEVTY